MLNPRKTNIALDANALDRNGTERDALVDRFNALRETRSLTIVLGGGVRAEVQNPRTPNHVQDAMLSRIFNLQPGLNTAQQETRRRVEIILQGKARPEKHTADASHLCEAAETGCGYFITEDLRILHKRAELSGVLPPSLKIVPLTEFFEIFDRFQPEKANQEIIGMSGYRVKFTPAGRTDIATSRPFDTLGVGRGLRH